ncbi:MAG: AAA family ATPase [bacterium]|nr:AAA family ATPase [bacterium]
MIRISGYQVKEQIYNSKNSVIYHGTSDRDGKPVVIKLLNNEFPTTGELARFRREYEITRRLKGDKIIRVYGMEKHNNSPAIILENFGGESLEKLLPVHKPGMGEKLSLAVKVTEALGQIHRQNLIHKDINPSNIAWNPGTNQVKIIDFGIATELARENPEIRNPNVLEGTIPYISPEQTGRMNRAMDYRTDLYSLGASLYEIFTGQRPFQGNDAMELVHCHIAKRPEAPGNLNPEIPAVLSNIIMKLLSKTAEERYQNTTSLQGDLEQCLDRLTSQGTIKEFEIGQNDISTRFQIPQKLYGRKEEITALLSAFERVSEGGKELMLVAGHPGIGKSALVQEINKPITAKRGHFLSGKFDQFKRNIPYSALIRAFGDLVKSLLAEKESVLSSWKEKLTKELGASARVVIDVIPEVELIIGKQPPVEKLDPEQARNRFNMVFQNFVRLFAAEDSPLVIFIDDLQWAGLPSLHLIEQFMTGMDTKHMLIIGAYRDNEIDESHPLTTLLQTLRKAECAISSITLKPLELKSINELLTETLLCKPETSYPLADLCAHKTGGNPFFLVQLLDSLYEERLIDFDANEGIWTYDLVKIKEVGVTDNVVELMVGRINKIGREAREILKLASCIGNQFDLDTLAIVSERPKNTIAEILFEALRENLLVPMDDSYKFVLESPGDLAVSYRFLHDRIQQAAYYLIEEKEKRKVHLKIGRLLLSNSAEPKTEEKIFDLVNHLNKGSELIPAQEEKDRLSELNLLAGQKAKNSAAYKPAYDYFKTGIELAGTNGWKRNYKLLLSLHEEGAEAAYLRGDYKESEHLFEAIMENTGSILDRVKSYEIRILTFTSIGLYQEAVDTGLSILKLLGVTFPKNPGKMHIALDLIKVKMAWRGKTDEEIVSFKEMKDPFALARVRILHKIAAAAYLSKPELFPINILKRLLLYIKYGNDPFSSFGTYAAFGLILCSIGDIDNGYRFGKLAENLLNRSPVKKDKTRVLLILNMFVRHWKEHLRETFKPSFLAYESRLETGDMEYASHAATTYCAYIFFSGKDLTDVEKEQSGFLNTINILKQKLDLDVALIYHQAVLNLLDPNGSLTDFSGTSFDEEKMVPVFLKEGNNHSLLVINLLKLNLNYLAGQYDDAFINSVQASKYLDSARAMFNIPYYYFFDSLTRLALSQKPHLKRVAQNQKKMKKWARHAPMNFLHKWHLVEAEKARVLGSDKAAIGHYKKAVELARANEYLQEEALALERYALFLLRKGEMDFAALIMKKAWYCYSTWGARAKVSLLEKTYSHLLREPEETNGTFTRENTKRSSSGLTIDTTGTEASAALDLATIMKASRALSRELVLSNLLVRLMEVSLENAGAEKGFMILEREGTLYVKAEAAAQQKQIPVLSSILLEAHQGLSAAIVQYAARTGETVILNNACAEGNFTNDPYVAANKAKSILCFPILNRGKLSGIVYLENNLSAGAFTPQRVEILEIFSSQAAISIENASLYQNLETKVKDRTLELEQANEKLAQRNRVIEDELTVARLLQQKLLPGDLPEIPGYRGEVIYIPMDKVGGDFYDFKTNENFIELFIADVSGHGLPGAFLSMITKMSFENITEKKSPKDVLVQINDVICRSTVLSNYVTAFYCIINRKTNVMRFSNAGHFPPFVYRKKSDEFFDLRTKGHPLGWFKTIKLEDKEIGLLPGDRVILYTDGITECENPLRELFGEERFKDFVRENSGLSPEEFTRALIAHLKEYSERDDFVDDLCLIVFDVV